MPGHGAAVDADVDEPVLERALRRNPTRPIDTRRRWAAEQLTEGPAVHRIVGDLISVGVLARLDGRLHLETHLFELGSLVPPNRELREAALPHMEDLYDGTHEIVHLGILAGPRSVPPAVRLAAMARPRAPGRAGRAGFDVPAGFLVTAAAYLPFADSARLDSRRPGSWERSATRPSTRSGALGAGARRSR